MTWQAVFSTPWFEIEERASDRPGGAPWYRMTGPDGVICLPFTPEGDLVLVRQHRINIDADTLETPAGGIDPGDTIEAAARREVAEEAGFRLGVVIPFAHGRLHLNRTVHREHFLLGFDAEPLPGAVVEAGLTPVVMPRAQFIQLVEHDQVEQIAALAFVGLASAKLGVDLLRDPIDLIRDRAIRLAAQSCERLPEL